LPATDCGIRLLIFAHSNTQKRLVVILILLFLIISTAADETMDRITGTDLLRVGFHAVN
jgi:hypothetical protein